MTEEKREHWRRLVLKANNGRFSTWEEIHEFRELSKEFKKDKNEKETRV